jgi:hypothetical protein
MTATPLHHLHHIYIVVPDIDGSEACASHPKPAGVVLMNRQASPAAP